LIDLKLVANGKVFMMGDIAEAGPETPQLQVSLAGTAPIDRVEIRNGVELIKTLRPCARDNLGPRLKIVWGGAQVRGRDRLVNWDGHLVVHGNSVSAAVPLNFWNANTPLEHISNRQLAWKSVTTGGTSGMILTLERLDVGTLEINTTQGHIEVDIPSMGLEPGVWNFGGLQKQIRIYRLPDQPPAAEFSFSLSVTGLHQGDNPIYIHMVQEDEHRAWTSPIYLVR